MHYKIDGTVVRAENAAKPTGTPARWLLDYIAALPPEWTALDLGCGKLRYTMPLADRVTTVVAADSAIQLSRRQTIAGQKETTVADYIKRHADNVHVLQADAEELLGMSFDFVLMANVLSAIPIEETRFSLVEKAGQLLRGTDSRLLIATNYANTRFRAWEGTDRASRYLDGWLIRSGGTFSFFGLIPLPRLRSYCEAASLRIVRGWTRHGEVAAVEATVIKQEDREG